MTSKQEKLAAARKKLKEFQGKNKPEEISRQKRISDLSAPKISKEYFESGASITCTSPLISKESFKNDFLIIHPNCVPVWPVNEGNLKENKKQSSNENNSSKQNKKQSSNENNSSKPWSEYCSLNEYLVKDESFKSQEGGTDFSNGLKADCFESHNVIEKNNLDSNMFRQTDVILPNKNHEKKENTFSLNETIKSESVEAKKFLNNEISNKNLNDAIKPLQIELQNHADTIKILVQERNNAQTALAEVQELLTLKSEKLEELNQQISHLTSFINNLNQKLSDAENVIMKLKLEKEENIQTLDKISLISDNLKLQLDTKEEELQEMKKKYEEKSNNCQHLLLSLHEAQEQLSLNQIQLQQYSPEGHSSLAIQISELQNENIGLKQKVIELEKRLEMESAEKGESSQKFHIYAQQCNSQLYALNSQLKSFKLENESLSQKNGILLKNLSELERSSMSALSSQSFENEIADLHNQLSALCEKSNQLQISLNQKVEECTHFEKELSAKDSETNKLLRKLEKLEEQNKKLANEAERTAFTPKVNERLLATMESDKIAAAKAVSQNQKLKEQVVELEKAFMKLSEEKLELTNQLAKEKHVNNELQNLLKNVAKPIGDYDNYECHHANEKQEPLINDSNEIDELRNIIRQLQDDKIELTARINSYESSKCNCEKKYEEKSEEKCEHNRGIEHEETQCENTKLLLQQMEEKVRKTMNEIAVLDEEKEKLEHLVLQLQGETETIGEYITLYQKQRMLLRQRAQEKDIQLLELSKDKEELKSKLVDLDELVQRLIAERESITVQPGSTLSVMNSSLEFPENTAGKIRTLINEIGSTTLLNNHSVAFKHCSCCSGRLITI